MSCSESPGSNEEVVLTTLRGKPALMHMYKRVQQVEQTRGVGDITLGDLGDFHGYLPTALECWTMCAGLSRLSLPEAFPKPTQPTQDEGQAAARRR